MNRRARPWYGRRGVQAIVALALGLLMALLLWGPRSGEQAKLREDGLATVPPAVELAVAWSNARTELSSRQDDDAAAWRSLPPAEMEADVPDSTAAESAADTPEWMVSAVVAMESEDEFQPSPASNVEGI